MNFTRVMMSAELLAAALMFQSIASVGRAQEAGADSKAKALALDPIPDLYDDFSDGKYEKRTGKDPWGRPLPEWTVELSTIDASEGHIRAKALAPVLNRATFSTPTDITKGTWVFRYNYPKGPPFFKGNFYTMSINVQFLNPPGLQSGYNGIYRGLYLNNPPDGHWWLSSGEHITGINGRVNHAGYIVSMSGSMIQPNEFSSENSYVAGKDWHEVTFIRDAEGFVYSWLDGDYVGWSTDKTENVPASTKFLVDLYDQTKPPLQYPIVVDDIRIYKDKYLPPVNSIKYDTTSGSIVIKGWGATLEKIAAAVNDPTVFAYNRVTSTATCHKDITIRPGSELRIEKSRLLLASMEGNERKIMYHTDSIFRITDSTVASADGRPFHFSRQQPSGRFRQANFKNNFKVVNSTLSDFDGLVLERPVAFCIENSKLLDLVGKYPIQVLFRWPIQELRIKKSIFKGKTGSETIAFQGGDQFRELAPKPVGMDIVDCDFSGVALEFLKDDPFYLSPGKPGCTVNLVNTKVGSVKSSGGAVRFKYYLDVLVADAKGKPVAGATVTVTNEQDVEKDNLARIEALVLVERASANSKTEHAGYPAENLITGQKYMGVAAQVSVTGGKYFTGQPGNWFKGLAEVNDHRAGTTGKDGRTALPSDQANTFVLTAKELRDGATVPFTYTIVAANTPDALT
ncbi:MAG: hypothetical protein KKE37_09695, partial [Verrucomicrobia bacterium]|nr:hypothetical protein [Verrucomicrobiota bacterium]MCG2680985.1 hypothetical protein [Kiritimatiellia bacterium]